MAKMNSKIIGVMSGKGGAGRTVIAINLAAMLKKLYNARVLLADCSISNPHVSLYLGIFSTPTTINDVLRGHVEPENAVYSNPSGVDVLPASLKLDDSKDLDHEKMPQIIENLENRYDFIVIDTPPGFGKECGYALELCSESVIVATPIVHSVSDVIKCKQLCGEFNVNPLGTAINMRRKKDYELSTEEFRQMTQTNILCEIPYMDEMVESTISKTPFVIHSPKHQDEFKKLAQFVYGAGADKKIP